MRVRRRGLDRLIYSDALRCSNCGYQLKRVYPLWRSKVQFIFSRYTHCIRCGTAHVQRISKRDRVDSVSKDVLSRIQQVIGAPLNKCVACRLQYYDWRPPKATE